MCVFVHGFEPYFYCDCPPNWSPEDNQELLYALRVRGNAFYSAPHQWQQLQQQTAARGIKPFLRALSEQRLSFSSWCISPAFVVLGPLQDHHRLKDRSGLGVPPVTRIEMVQKINLWQYQGGQSRQYLKIVCALPNLVAPARGEPILDAF